MRSALSLLLMLLLLTSCDGNTAVEQNVEVAIDATPRFDTTNSQRLNESWTAVMYSLSDDDQKASAIIITEYFQLTSGGEGLPFHNPANTWTYLMHDQYRPIMLKQLYEKMKKHPQYAGKDIHGMSAMDLLVLAKELRARKHLQATEKAKQQRGVDERQLERLRAMLPEVNEKLIAAIDAEKRAAAALQVKINNFDNLAVEVKAFRIESHDARRKMYKVIPTLRIVNNSTYDLQVIGLDLSVEYNNGVKKKITSFNIKKQWHMGRDSLRPGEVIEPTLPQYRVTYGSHRVDASHAEGFKLVVEVSRLIATDRQRVTAHDYKTWVKGLGNKRQSDRIRREIAQIKSQIATLEATLSQQTTSTPQ